MRSCYYEFLTRSCFTRSYFTVWLRLCYKGTCVVRRHALMGSRCTFVTFTANAIVFQVLSVVSVTLVDSDDSDLCCQTQNSSEHGDGEIDEPSSKMSQPSLSWVCATACNLNDLDHAMELYLTLLFPKCVSEYVNTGGVERP